MRSCQGQNRESQRLIRGDRSIRDGLQQLLPFLSVLRPRRSRAFEPRATALQPLLALPAPFYRRGDLGQVGAAYLYMKMLQRLESHKYLLALL